MNREEIESKVDAALEYDDIYDLSNIISELLDEFKSRTCENCEHNEYISNSGYCHELEVYDMKFCNKFKNKV